MATNPAKFNINATCDTIDSARHIAKCVYPFTDKENRAVARNNMTEAFARHSDADGLISLVGISKAMKDTIYVNGGACEHGALVSGILAESFDLAVAAACFHAVFAVRFRNNSKGVRIADGRVNRQRREECERFDASGLVKAHTFISLYIERIYSSASRRVYSHTDRSPAGKLEFELTDFCSPAEMINAVTLLRAPFADVFVDADVVVLSETFFGNDSYDDGETDVDQVVAMDEVKIFEKSMDDKSSELKFDPSFAGYLVLSDDDDEDIVAKDKAPMDEVKMCVADNSSKLELDATFVDWFAHCENDRIFDVADLDDPLALPMPDFVRPIYYDPTDPFGIGFVPTPILAYELADDNSIDHLLA